MHEAVIAENIFSGGSVAPLEAAFPVKEPQTKELKISYVKIIKDSKGKFVSQENLGDTLPTVEVKVPVLVRVPVYDFGGQYPDEEPKQTTKVEPWIVETIKTDVFWIGTLFGAILVGLISAVFS